MSLLPPSILCCNAGHINRRIFNFISVGLVISLMSVANANPAEALLKGLEQWEYGSGMGFISGSPDGTKFGMVFTADYYPKNTDFSIGPMIQLIPPGDFTLIAGAVVGRYHFDLHRLFPSLAERRLQLVPFMGLGGLHSEVKRQIGGVTTITNDMSYYGTAGLSLDWNFDKRFGLSATYMNNLHDIRTGDGRDRDSSSFFLSLRFRLKD